MTGFLDRCNNLYNYLLDCSDKYSNKYKDRDCFKCLKYNFYGKNLDTYDCLKKLSVYVLYYGELYVKEIYHFLDYSKVLEKEHLFPKGTINILSLGAGFCPDNIAIEQYVNKKNLNLKYNYYGFDIESGWREIRDDKNIEFAHWRTNPKDTCEILPKIRSVLYDMNLSNYDIIFINKLFSTLVNHEQNKLFLRKFNNALKNLPQGSIVILNDRNEYTIIKEFEDYIDKSLKLIDKYYIEAPYSPHIKDFKEIIFDYNPSNELGKPDKNKTNFLVYQKV
ncbi:hypothetical protein [Aliarcobacter butzleri]|uniref:hypothetical protein n=1 Tax=Aliarcobacter butzleri TaxID=28197 RepID=UPI003AF536BE